MQLNKVIAVWGNPNSGKTTLSIKLANELTKRKKNVILIHCDHETPVISTVLPFVTTKDQSLGALLSAMQITQESILKACIPVSGNRNLTVMSYLHGENDRTYAKYSKERIVDLFILIKHLADHIIIDCSSHVGEDLFSRAAIELSDQVFRLTSPDLKAISFFDSCLPLLGERKYKVGKQLKVLSNVKSEMPRDMVANKFGGIYTELKHVPEIERQFYEARLFEPLVEKKSKPYKQEVVQLVDMMDDEAEKEVRKQKKAKVKKEKENNDEYDYRPPKEKKSFGVLFKKRGEK
jgi:MinD-like ATPase involved in chromosome partitioning or flagellar assembly